jgi:hypothetical protein
MRNPRIFLFAIDLPQDVMERGVLGISSPGVVQFF